MDTTSQFTPWSSLAGGTLIGLAASVLLIGSGRIAGISGIAADFAFGRDGHRLWRALFLLGLAVTGLGAARFAPGALGTSPRSLAGVAVAGVLVGMGTRLGGGCTSGHGVCGLSRLSARSLAATLTFMATGAATAAAVRWLGGVS